MTEYDAIVVHFGELWLKGRNRGAFIGQLRRNIGVSLSGSMAKLTDERDHFIVHPKEGSFGAALDRLRYVFGISWFAPVVFAKNDIESIIKGASRILKRTDNVRVVAQRSYKKTGFTSYDIVSAFIKNSSTLGFGIDKGADRDLFVSVTRQRALVYTEKIGGAGGLPVGTSGKAVILLSGGLDSPVAAYYAMKRGLMPVYLHVHAFQDGGSVSSSKIPRIIDVLSKYSSVNSAYYVPFYLFQSATMKIPKRYELVVFKLFMYRLAERIAEREKAEVIVTGESLGQVASQTVGNMLSSQQGVSRLILRPLSGFDKGEIVGVARRIGTYDLSIQEYKDVCSIGVRNPATSAKAKTVMDLYDECGLDEVLDRTLELALREGQVHPVTRP